MNNIIIWRKMEQNLAKIISNKTSRICASKILGICESKYHLYEENNVLCGCKKCGILVCGYCINYKNNKCVMCKIGVSFEKKCKCLGNMQYYMCYHCEKLLRICIECYDFDDRCSSMVTSKMKYVLICEMCS